MLTCFDTFRTTVRFALGEKPTISWCKSKTPPRDLVFRLQKANSDSLCHTRAGEENVKHR